MLLGSDPWGTSRSAEFIPQPQPVVKGLAE